MIDAKAFLILFLTFSLFYLQAQDCVTTDLIRLQKEDSNYVQQILNIEKKRVVSISLRSNNEPKIIPVVFHVISEDKKLTSKTTTFEAVEYLNSVFPFEFIHMGYNDFINELGEHNRNSEQELLKNFSRWNPNYFLNIWVVDDVLKKKNRLNILSGKLGGYATLSSVSGTFLDGVVIDKDYLLQPTLPHEIGHYFNLYHLFQNFDLNDLEGDGDFALKANCNETDSLFQGDLVPDTHPVIRKEDNIYYAYSGCNSEDMDNYHHNKKVSCGYEPLLTTNFMSYQKSLPSCRNSFTYHQIERMKYFAVEDRDNLGKIDKFLNSFQVLNPFGGVGKNSRIRLDLDYPDGDLNGVLDSLTEYYLSETKSHIYWSMPTLSSFNVKIDLIIPSINLVQNIVGVFEPEGSSNIQKYPFNIPKLNASIVDAQIIITNLESGEQKESGWFKIVRDKIDVEFLENTKRTAFEDIGFTTVSELENVKIYLSIDGGLTYPYPIDENFAYSSTSGTKTWNINDSDFVTDQAVIRVSAVDDPYIVGYSNVFRIIGYDDCNTTVELPVYDIPCAFFGEETQFHFLSATNTGGNPSCGMPVYVGDVWAKIEIPSSGHLVIEGRGDGGGNLAMSLSEGTCGNLTEIACNDDRNSRIDINGLTPNSTVFLRLWYIDNVDNSPIATACAYDGGAKMPHCLNGVMDEDEIAIDCGGSCAPCPGNYEVIAPNGGEDIIGNTYHTITWNGENSNEEIYLQLSLDGGTTWEYPTNSGFSYTNVPNMGTYNWFVPCAIDGTLINSNNCKIGIFSATNNVLLDESDTPFTINTCNTNGKPNLTIEYLDAPSVIDPTKSFDVSVAITNNSNFPVPAYNDPQVSVYISDDETLDNSDSRLRNPRYIDVFDAFEDDLIYFDDMQVLLSAFSGNKYFIAVVDESAEVEETNEQDNIHVQSVFFDTEGLGEADMIIEDAAVRPTTGVYLGNGFNLNFTYQNVGAAINTGYANSECKVYLSSGQTDIELGSFTLVELDNYERYSTTLSLTLPNTLDLTSSWQIKITLDENDAIAEGDETNNIYYTPINTLSGTPQVAFLTQTPDVCSGESVAFKDITPNIDPVSWQWSFQGGNPSTSTAAQPVIAYANAGTYDVSLTATFADGSQSTETKVGYITVSENQSDFITIFNATDIQVPASDLSLGSVLPPNNVSTSSVLGLRHSNPYDICFPTPTGLKCFYTPINTGEMYSLRTITTGNVKNVIPTEDFDGIASGMYVPSYGSVVRQYFYNEDGWNFSGNIVNENYYYNGIFNNGILTVLNGDKVDMRHHLDGWSYSVYSFGQSSLETYTDLWVSSEDNDFVFIGKKDRIAKLSIDRNTLGNLSGTITLSSNLVSITGNGDYLYVLCEDEKVYVYNRLNLQHESIVTLDLFSKAATIEFHKSPNYGDLLLLGGGGENNFTILNLDNPTNPTQIDFDKETLLDGKIYNITNISGQGGYTFGSATDRIYVQIGNKVRSFLLGQKQVPDCYNITGEITPNGIINNCDAEPVILTAPAGGNYLWSNGATSRSIEIEQSGTYSVMVSSCGSCSFTTDPVEVHINQEAFTLNHTTQNETCYQRNGQINLAPSGGQLPYTFLWRDGNTEGNRTGLGKGEYGLTVTDANGCTQIDSFSLFNVGERSSASFEYQVNGLNVELTGGVTNANSFNWILGDGNTTNSLEVAHVYDNEGVVNICLDARNSCYDSTFCRTVFLSNPANCESNSSPNIEWDKTFGASSTEELKTILPIENGGYILGGQSASTNNGDRMESSRGSWDYWIVKTDANGTKEWDKRFGGSSVDNFQKIIATQDGGFLLGGHSASSNDGDKSQTSRGSYDYWIIKIDESGNKIWDKRYGGSAADYLASIVLTADGGYLLAGSSQSGNGGDKTEVSRGNWDYWVVKINANGTKVWDKRFGGSAVDNIKEVIPTDDGFLLAGESQSTNNGDKTETSRGGYDYWVVKIDANGTKIWDKRFGGSGSDNFESATQTNNGFILAGRSQSSNNGDKTAVSKGFTDYWIVKIDENGQKEWDKGFGTNRHDHLYGIAENSNGYILTGFAEGLANGDKTESSNGSFDYWIIKTDLFGNLIWDKTIGGSGTDRGFIAQNTLDNGFMIGGNSTSSISGNKSEVSRGNTDYWVLKFVGCEGECSDNLTFSTKVSNDRMLQAGQKITSSSIISNGNVTFRAGESISLETGFHAQAGSDFLATIADCEPVNNIENPEVVYRTAISTPKKEDGIRISVQPNPFTSSTIIDYQLAKSENISIVLYSLQGEKIQSLKEGQPHEKGQYRLLLDRNALRPGMYILLLSTEQGQIPRKVIVLD